MYRLWPTKAESEPLHVIGLGEWGYEPEVTGSVADLHWSPDERVLAVSFAICLLACGDLHMFLCRLQSVHTAESLDVWLSHGPVHDLRLPPAGTVAAGGLAGLRDRPVVGLRLPPAVLPAADIPAHPSCLLASWPPKLLLLLLLQVGWRRCGIGLWSASGCRLLCSLRQTPLRAPTPLGMTSAKMVPMTLEVCVWAVL